ncbi:MAG TPA: UDP-N-acetylmuramoyl-tripeptide--D-alanyl-D-alanine ligase [Puia sp.]|jgi:UDP-N-acetylmuramoyl-tripeptide--D-alanyl-D-alanine ligase
MNIESLYQLFLRHPSIQTDTRKLKGGDLFFALKGPNFNGNLFAVNALKLGAAYAIIDEAPAEYDQAAIQSSGNAPTPANLPERLILVDDVLTTLQALALHHRRQFTIPFIAITGSNGKTTTKELVHAVLSTTYITYTTQGNLNNHIGIPLTILSVKKDAQFAVIEMGANHQKEIEGYCRYTLPTHGIITNAGKAHLEGFGGPEGVKKGKGELYTFLREHNGTAFVMWDYEYLQEMSKGVPHIVRYGTRDAEVTGIVDQYSADSFLHVRITSGTSIDTISTQLVGDYNLPNVLVAVTVGRHFGVPDEQIRQSIEAYAPSNSRSQLILQGSNHIILDAYNANPSSMKAAIGNFAKMQEGRAVARADKKTPGKILPQDAAAANDSTHPNKVLVLGAMAELGEESLDEHRQIIDLIGQYPWQQVALVGGDFLRIPHPYLSFKNSREAGDWLRQSNFKDTWLLIKGSRSTKMEEVLS